MGSSTFNGSWVLGVGPRIREVVFLQLERQGPSGDELNGDGVETPAVRFDHQTHGLEDLLGLGVVLRHAAVKEHRPGRSQGVQESSIL